MNRWAGITATMACAYHGEHWRCKEWTNRGNPCQCPCHRNQQPPAPLSDISARLRHARRADE